ncbi:MAG: HNH endonuclease [Ignavibacteria bacterium]|nr:HNH endonuclease [Ignavibacteria bacterium]
MHYYCRNVYCRNPVHRKGSFCPDCKQYLGEKRPYNNFYNSKAWKRLRIYKLTKNPLCEICLEMNIKTLAIEVDHITPIEQGGNKYKESNLQSICKQHHSQKTIGERNGNKGI